MSQQFKSPIDQAADMQKPTAPVGGKSVSLKGGGTGYKFEGDKYAHILHPTLEEAKKHYATAEGERMAAWKSQNRMPALRHSPVIVKQPDGDGFMVLELGDVKRYGLRPYKEEPDNHDSYTMMNEPEDLEKLENEWGWK